jgi:hypothetical protein
MHGAYHEQVDSSSECLRVVRRRRDLGRICGAIRFTELNRMGKGELRGDLHSCSLDPFEPVDMALVVEAMHDRRQLVAAACVPAYEGMGRRGSVTKCTSARWSERVEGFVDWKERRSTTES